MQKELRIRPLMFGEFEVKQREADKYLGEIIHEDGLGRSAEATVEDRIG